MSTPKKWIWQHPDYPQFNYDLQALLPRLREIAFNTGKLHKVVDLLDDEEVRSLRIDSYSNEILKTSEIEGEYLQRDSVKDSLRKKLDNSFDYGKDRSTRETDALADILIDANYNNRPLSLERLHGWHHALFPSGYSSMTKICTGIFRDYDDMTVGDNRLGSDKVYYLAIPAPRIEEDINKLLAYINHSDDDPYIKSALAHIWFVSIHPYDDGNGRVSRVIADFILSKDLGLANKYYSVSAAIHTDKKGYYEVLEKSQNLFYNRTFDFTKWLIWHLDTHNNAILITLQKVEQLIEKIRFWNKARLVALNDRQIKVINRLLDIGIDNFEGALSAKKYMAMTKTSIATAKRDIQALLKHELLQQVDGTAGRSTRYMLHIGKKPLN